MRELKFRVWDKENKKWLEYGENHKNLTITEIGKLNIDVDQESEYIFCQYIGFEDETGKEIYEGDILQTKELEINMKWVVEIPRVYLTLLPFGKIRQDNSLIIGNIYENPELLNNN